MSDFSEAKAVKDRIECHKWGNDQEQDDYVSSLILHHDYYKVGDMIKSLKTGCMGKLLDKDEEGWIQIENIGSVTPQYLATCCVRINLDGLPDSGEFQGAITSVEEVEDNVNHPKHYTNHPSGVECIQITEHFNFCIGNAIKYLWRCHEKHETPLEDLKKARWYLDREIEGLENA